ncbi:MAG TPA: hypothetical protein VJJ83_03195, partial [Candidatus Babeliales bacterium]|nr:hypothetical protein [Candidatus Babeliales bacterium]
MTDLSEIAKPAAVLQFADYFITALGTDGSSPLFVQNSEYPANAKPAAPVWSLYLNGHGLTDLSIAHLSIPQFKNLLEFLAAKINTKLLYYQSCYAAGTNTVAVYHDEQTKIQKTYPYAIITGALTDMTIASQLLTFKVENNVLKVEARQSYRDFLAQATATDQIDYHRLAATITRDLTDMDFGLSSTPQIKFPGLAWFSVLDEEKVVSIGVTLAKARTAALDIAKFFARTNPAVVAQPGSVAGQAAPTTAAVATKSPAKPLGILLYTAHIPFELIVNSGAIAGRAPDIISMIPGDAAHYLQQLTTQVYPVDQLLNSFLRVEDLLPQKVFVIDHLTGLNVSKWPAAISRAVTGTTPLTLQKVVVHLTPAQKTVYFTHNNAVYMFINQLSPTNKPQRANAAAVTDYQALLRQYDPTAATSVSAVAAAFTAVQTQAETEFAQLLPTDTAIKAAITQTLTTVPNQAVLRLPTLRESACPAEQGLDCWMNSFEALSQLPNAADSDKVLWFQRVEQCTAEQHCTAVYQDLIMHAYKGSMGLFATNLADNSLINFVNGEYNPDYTGDYQADYVNRYQAFAKRYQLELD